MGVDYSAVGGIGIEFTDEMKAKLIDIGEFTKDEWNDDPDGCISSLGLKCGNAGSYYSGDIYWYLFVDGSSLYDIINNSHEFLHKLNQMGFDVKQSDLVLISEILCW